MGTEKNSDARVKIVNLPVLDGETPVRVVIVGGGGTGAVMVVDGDDQPLSDLPGVLSRLQGYDPLTDSWDRARVRYGGLEARDDYATFEPQRRVLAPAVDEAFVLPGDTRLIRVTNWSLSQRVHVSPAELTDTADDCAFVGVAPASNLSNCEWFPVRLAEIHLWADGGAEVTVEAFRGP